MEIATELVDGTEVPVSFLARRRRLCRYGTVPGLPVEELADPDELERQVYLMEWGPVLQLPVRGRSGLPRPHYDENFGLDWGAFATVDFDRMKPQFDAAKYKADRLREELRDCMIMVAIIRGHLQPRVVRAVWQVVRSGVRDIDDIKLGDAWMLARWCQRALRIQRQIRELEARSRDGGRDRPSPPSHGPVP